MREFFKTFIAYGLATFIDKLVVLIFIPIYARYLTVEEFGSMDLVQSIISIFSIFIFLQLEASLQRYFYEYEDEQLKVFASTIIYFVFTLSLLMVGLFTLFTLFTTKSLFFATVTRHIMVMGLWQIPFICLYTLSTILIRFSKKYNIFYRIILVSLFINILFPYLLVVRFKLGLTGFFQAQLACLMIITVYSIYNVRQYFVSIFSINSLKIALAYALPQFPARVGNVLNTYASRFAITGFMNAYNLGIFALSVKISSVIQIIYHFFISFWNQIIFEIKSRNNHKEILIFMFKATNSVIFFIITILSLYSSDIVNIISEKFSEGAYLVGILSFSSGLLIVKEVIDIGPKYLKKSKYLTINFSYSVIFNFLSLFILVPILGLLGVGISFVISSLSLLIFSWYNSHKLYPINFSIMNLIINIFPCFLVIFFSYSFLSSSSPMVKFFLLLCVSVYYISSFWGPFKKLLSVYK